MDISGKVNPFKTDKPVADKAVIRRFVQDLAEASDNVKLAKEDLREAISSNDEIQKIDEEIERLREERKEIIENNPVIIAYKEKVDEATDDRKQLISDARDNNVPKGEIDVAIKMLKSDLDPTIASSVYADIADLVE